MTTTVRRRPGRLGADGALEVLACVVTADRLASARDALMPALAGWLGANQAILWWRSEATDRWHRWASWPSPARLEQPASSQPPSELSAADLPALPGAQLQAYRSAGDSRIDPGYRRHAAAAGATHRLLIPLPAAPRPSSAGGGLAELFLTNPRELAAADHQLLDQLGRQLGPALARLAELAAIRADNLLLSAQMEGTPDGTVVVSPDRRVIAHNHRILEMFGLSEEQLRTDAPTEVSLRQVRDAIAHDPSMLPLLQWAHEHITDSIRRTVELADGRVLDMYGAPVFDRDGHYHGRAWYARDITARTRAERALRTVSDTLQRALRPPHLPTVPGVEFAGRYQAGGEAIEVGGDFYDVFAVGERRWAVLLGDVCGQGAHAAAVTALARHTVRAVAARAGPPSSVLAALNTALVEQDPGVPFVTAVYLTLALPPVGQIAPVTARLTCAGHPSPLLARRDGTMVSCGTPGSLLGVLDEPALTDVGIRLSPGDTLVLVTDGVLEARDASGTQFGETGLRQVLAGVARRTAEQTAAAIEAAVLDHRKGDRSDDFAILAITVPAGPPSPG